MTPIKDQGNCGACYAFAAAACLETSYWKHTGELVELSEQQIVDCASTDKYGNLACNGGLPSFAFQYSDD